VEKQRGRLPGRGRRACRAATPTVVRPHQEYVRRRARQIAYGTWEPWADAAVVRRHVRRLRAAGVSYEAIASAAGVSPMTVHRVEGGRRTVPGRGCAMQRSPGRVRAVAAQRLLAVTSAAVEQRAVRRDAIGTRRRLQALIALGYPAAWLARRLGVEPRRVSRVAGGITATVTRRMHVAVCDLYDQLWDVRPPEQTPAERRAAAAARAVAAGNGWPTPMGLDDDRIDDPAYQPRARWRPAVGNVAGHSHHRERLSTVAASSRKLSTVGSARASSPASRCQSANAQCRPGGRL
jgi:AcrR family transcriptional regulator